MKEECRYAKIKNILLDSVPGAVDFYKLQDFDSIKDKTPKYENLKRMTLKKELTPFNSEPKKTVKSSFHSFTPNRISQTISNRTWKSPIQVRVDDTTRHFQSTENQSVKNIIDHFESKMKTNNDKTLMDLENNKEYILVDNNLYVSNEKQNNSTRRRIRSINTSKRSVKRRRM